MAWVHDHRIDFSESTRINIHAISDWQLGSESTDEDLVRRKVREIVADPCAYWVFLGDIEDDDRPTTRARRRSAFGDRPEVLDAGAEKHTAWIDKHVIPIMAPLTARPCLGVLAGHHWRELSRNWNSVQYICTALTKLGPNPVPYLGQMSAWLRLGFNYVKNTSSGTFSRTVHIQHGSGGGQAVGSSLRKLDVTSARVHADAYIRAHSCQIEATKFDVVAPCLGVGNNRLKHRTVPLLNIGSATRTFNIGRDDPAYPEWGMMRPQTMGWGVLKAYIRKAPAKRDPGRSWDVEWKIEI